MKEGYALSFDTDLEMSLGIKKTPSQTDNELDAILQSTRAWWPCRECPGGQYFRGGCEVCQILGIDA